MNWAPTKRSQLTSSQNGERPLASVIIVNTNELQHLQRCLPSVCDQTYDNYEVIIVDNGSTDGSVEFINRGFPGVRVIDSGGNHSYPGANNIGFEHARGDYFAVLNPDTEVERRWLEALVVALESDDSAGLATSKILLMNDPSRINACGNEINLSGLTYCRGLDEPSSAYPDQEYVAAVSGASFLVRRSIIDDIGPFDADFIAYLEETDISLRAHLQGYRSLYVPGSRVLHDYHFNFTERKCFNIEKNRLYMLLKTFKPLTLLLLAPALVFTEILVWGYMLKQGRRYARQKLNSYVWLWRSRHKIAERRAAIQRTRVVSDRELLQSFVPTLPFPQLIQGTAGRVMERICSAFMSVMSRIPMAFAN